MKVCGNRIKKNGNEHPDTEKEGGALGFHAAFSGIFDDGQAPEEAEEAPGVKVGTNVENVVDVVVANDATRRSLGMGRPFTKKGGDEESKHQIYAMESVSDLESLVDFGGVLFLGD